LGIHAPLISTLAEKSLSFPETGVGGRTSPLDQVFGAVLRGNSAWRASTGDEGKTGALYGLVLADRTAGRYGQALPLGEDEAAFAANRGNQAKTKAAAGGPGQVLEVRVHLFFREGELPGQLLSGQGLLLEQLSHGLTNGVHLNGWLGLKNMCETSAKIPGKTTNSLN
jgi:hypothetical protein